MSIFFRIMSPVHNFILICAFISSMGFGMLISFNKRVAEEKTSRAVVTMGVSMPLRSLIEIRISDI